MIQVGYYVTDAPLSRNSYENRKEEIVTKTTTSRKTVTTKTKREITVDKSDVHAVKTLTTDLRNGLDMLKEDLRAEQNDVHAYEDSRSDNLAHLETVHSELEKEHINDQVRGVELSRLDRQVTSEINIETSNFEDEKESLRRFINHTDDIIKEKVPIVDSRKEEHTGLEKTLAKSEDIKASNLSEASTVLRKDNADLKKKIEESAKSVKTEKEGKLKVFNDHAALVKSYDSVVQAYSKLHSDSEMVRNKFEREYIQTSNELAEESAQNVNLTHYINATDKAREGHKGMTDALRKDLEGLRKHYGAFDTQLSSFITGQSSEMSKLEGDLDTAAKGIESLQKELSTSVTKIVELHGEVDKENAANLNAKLSQLIGTLVDVDKYRRVTQNKLEDSQQSWTAKLSLFEEEANRMSRENANTKRAAEIEKLLNKLDKLNKDRNEIARERDEIDLKLVTDENRDTLSTNLEREREGLNLKLRWASDEIVKTHSDLQELLKFLAFKRGFLSDQEEQIKTLRIEITEVRTRITQCTITITELSEELRLLNIRIEELLRLIAQQDNEIEELKRILDERNKRIVELSSHLQISTYTAMKGDMVDELLAKYIQNCPVPVKRLGGGFYLFGLRKIYAKVMNGKLVIRVGGGYMIIEKFIETYADTELDKLNRVAAREGVDSFMELDLEAIALGPKNAKGASPKAGSPKAGSPKAGSPKGGKSSKNEKDSSGKFGSVAGSAKKSATTKKIVKTTNGGTTTTTTTTTTSSRIISS
jgi:chromosome segregation ATPase